MKNELETLSDASMTLNRLSSETARVLPRPLWSTIYHAEQYVDGQIEALKQGEPFPDVIVAENQSRVRQRAVARRVTAHNESIAFEALRDSVRVIGFCPVCDRKTHAPACDTNTPTHPRTPTPTPTPTPTNTRTLRRSVPLFDLPEYLIMLAIAAIIGVLVFGR